MWQSRIHTLTPRKSGAGAHVPNHCSIPLSPTIIIWATLSWVLLPSTTSVVSTSCTCQVKWEQGCRGVPDVTFALRRRASKKFWFPLYPKLNLAYRFPIKVISGFVPAAQFFSSSASNPNMYTLSFHSSHFFASLPLSLLCPLVFFMPASFRQWTTEQLARMEFGFYPEWDLANHYMGKTVSYLMLGPGSGNTEPKPSGLLTSLIGWKDGQVFNKRINLLLHWKFFFSFLLHTKFCTNCCGHNAKKKKKSSLKIWLSYPAQWLHTLTKTAWKSF